MPSRFSLSQTSLVRGFAVLTLFALGSFVSASAQAQTARTGTSTTTGAAATGTAAAGGEIVGGNAIDPASLFSSTTTDSGTNFGQLGANAGRFSASAVQNAPTATGGTNQAQQGGNRAFQQFNQRGGNRNSQQQFNRQFGNQNRTTTRTVRPSLRLGFALPARPNTDIQGAATSRVTAVASRVSAIADTQPAFRGIEVAAADGVVTLTGTVPDEAASRLAANILRMESGVRSVKNELTVATP